MNEKEQSFGGMVTYYLGVLDLAFETTRSGVGLRNYTWPQRKRFFLQYVYKICIFEVVRNDEILGQWEEL